MIYIIFFHSDVQVFFIFINSSTYALFTQGECFLAYGVDWLFSLKESVFLVSGADYGV